MPRSNKGLVAGLRAMVFAALVVLVGAVLASPAAAQSCPDNWEAVPGTSGSGTMCEWEGGGDGDAVERALATDLNARPADLGEDDTTVAVRMFYFSMGLTADGTAAAEAYCLTCDYITHITTALATFSASLFTFFQGWFVSLAPLLLSSWVGWQVLLLSLKGGEGGGPFAKEMLKKFGLFFVLWVLLFDGFGLMGPQLPGTGTTGATYFAGPAWHTLGPETMRLSYAIGGDVRNGAAENLLAFSGQSVDTRPFQCQGLNDRVRALVRNDSLNATVQAITQTACVMERVHSVGLASAVGIATSIWGQVLYTGEGMAAAIVGSIAALLLAVIYFYSMMWFIFVLVDVAIRAFIIAAISPLLALAALFQSTREIAMAGFRNLIAVPVVAFVLGVFAVLGFILILNVPTVYETSRVIYGQSINLQMQPIEASSMVDRFVELLERAQLEKIDARYIAFDLLSPWVVYLLITGLMMSVLGRKLLAVISEILGIEGTYEMADNMRGLITKGAVVGVGVGAAMTAVASVPVAGAAGAAGSVAAKGAGAGITKAGTAFGKSAMGRGVRAAGSSFRNTMGKISPFGRGGQGEDGR
jgi:hypothetical protein